MRRWRVWHQTRSQGAIGRWAPQHAYLWADNQRDALEKHRRMLWDAGWETAGGEAKPDNEKEDAAGG